MPGLTPDFVPYLPNNSRLNLRDLKYFKLAIKVVLLYFTRARKSRIRPDTMNSIHRGKINNTPSK